MIFLLVATILFHVLVLLQVVPYTIVGGGRITSVQGMYRMEGIALAMNLIMLWIVLMWTGATMPLLGRRILRTLLWLMFVLFLVNTLGNLFAVTWTETLIFTPITLILAICSLRLALDKQT
jgi:hypothetical protein